MLTRHRKRAHVIGGAERDKINVEHQNRIVIPSPSMRGDNAVRRIVQYKCEEPLAEGGEQARSLQAIELRKDGRA